MPEVDASPEVVLSHLDQLPTLPAVAVRVLQLTVDTESTAEDVVKLLRADQSLTAKILSVANSAAVGVRGQVTTLEKAVPLLGFSAVRSIVLATGVFECFSQRAGAAGAGAFDRAEFWKHSLAVACAARSLAKLHPSKRVDAEDAFVAGLLHDLGKVALDTVFPKAYDRIVGQTNHSRGDIADAERVVLGADHTVAGRRLAERWKLPAVLQRAIWLHHLAPEALPASVSAPELIGVVELGDTIAREQRIGYSGNHVFYDHSPRLAERLGFPAEVVDAVVQTLASDVAAQAALLGLDGETAEGLYVQAMTRANAELGRLNADLMSGNRRLATGARYFNAITRFERELSDWSDPAAVIAAVAEAAAGALQRPHLAAFGLRQNLTAVDVTWIGEESEERGRETRNTPVELLTWISQAGELVDQLVVPAPQPVRDLLADAFVSESTGRPWLLSIFHENELAGGIVYLSEQNERDRLAGDIEELRSFLASLGLALGRANAQTAARRLSEDLAETNRRLQHMQTELLRSRTLSMIAEMAAGAGHELNSPLTVISGRAQMLLASLADPEAKRALETIVGKAHECSRIVSELMDFARPRPPKLAPVELAELYAEVRSEWLEQSALGPGQILIEADAEVTDDGQTVPLQVQADRGLLKIVLQELLSNATDALETGDGTITLRCQAALQPDMVELIVEDTGCGMSPAVLQRAFDPFYSHRNAGRSRGLGLPQAYRFVEAHGGRIWLESRPGEGTTAHVLLPRAGGSA